MSNPYKLTLADSKTGQQSYLKLIGKSDSDRALGKAAREFEVMRALWEAGFGQDSGLTIPRPVQLFPELKLILQERARGLKLCRYLGRDGQMSLVYARRAGLWLAKLHGLRTTSTGVCSYRDELTALDVFVQALSQIQAPLAPQVRRLQDSIRQRFGSFRDVPQAMVHGDYHSEHIFVARDNVTVIDFERFCLSDPAKDLGSFIAHMRTHACFLRKSLDAANRQIAAFLDGYFSVLPVARGAALVQRIEPFVQHCCLEALYYVACVLRVRDVELMAMYLRCAEQAALPALERSQLFEAYASAASVPAAKAMMVGA